MKPRSPVLGYNTNLKYRGLVFHVQTEDSGVANPHIFTHLFFEGTILHTRKTVYEVASSVETVKGLMQAQQKAVLKELTKAKFDDKIDQYLVNTPGLLPRGAVAPEPAPAAAPAPQPVAVPQTFPRPAPTPAVAPRPQQVIVGTQSRTVGQQQRPDLISRVAPLIQPKLLTLGPVVDKRSAAVGQIARRLAKLPLDTSALRQLSEALSEHVLENAIVASHLQVLKVVGDSRMSPTEADLIAAVASAVALIDWYAATAP